MAENMDLQINITGENDTSGSFDNLDSAMSELQKLAMDVSRNFEDFARTISSSFAEVSSEAQNTEKSLEEMIRPLFDSAVESATHEMAKGITEIGTAAQEATQEINKMDEAAGKSHGAPGGHGNESLFGLQGQMDTMYAGMAMGAAAAPLDAGLGASVKAMADFDQAMRLVNEEMGLSNDKFGQLEQSILSLSNATGISSQDLANGLYNVVATGVTNTSDALNLLKVSAEGAKAGNTDLNTATKAVNAVMGAYGMNAKDAGQIMDVMFTAVNNGQMHFTDLAKSVGASATSAATAGVSYTELAAAQATLTNVGKNAESASQNLNSLIMGMIAPTSEATKEAKKLGIEWDAQALKSHGLSYMIDEATKATHGNSEELKKLVPNQRAYMAVLALGSNAHKQYTDTLNKMKDAHGATEEALKQTEQGAGESIEKMKAELTNAGIQIAMGLAPALKEVADKVQELTKWFSSLSPHTQKLIGEVALGAAAFLTLGSSFFMTISAIGGMVSGLKAVSGAMKALFISEEAVAAGEALIDSLNPVGWVILITAAVVAVAALIITHWTQIKTFLTSTWNATIAVARQIWGSITTFFSGLWKSISQTAMNTWNSIKNFFTGLWNGITQTASTIWNGMINGIKSIWSGAISWIKGAAQSFVNAIVNAFNWMYNHNYYFKDLVDFIRNEWNTAVNDAKSIWNGITNFLSSAWNSIVSVGKTTWNGFVNILSTVWNTISNVATSFWNREMSGLQNIWNAIVNAARTVWNGLTSFFSSLWNSISSGVSSAWNSIHSTVSNQANAAVNAVKTPFNSLGSFFSGLWGQAEQWGENLINMVTKGIQNAASGVGDAVKSVAGKIAGFLGFHSPTKEGPGSDADTWMPNMIKMFTEGIHSHAPQLQMAISNVALGVKAGFTTPLTQNISSTMALPNGSGGGNVYYITVHANGNITKNEQELADRISTAFLTKTKMQGRI